MIALGEAQARVLALRPPVAIETVPLGEAGGRWLSADLLARRTQPARDLSAMDGFAIRLADRAGPWTIIGEATAGRRYAGALGQGEAVRISTGAAVPDGADTVVMQENVARDGGALRLTGDAAAWPGQHVRKAGSDFADGAPLADGGDRVTPALLALAAMAGHATLPVRRKVRVALIATGDELVPPGTAIGDDRIPASNSLMLTAMLAGLPCDINDMGIVGDTETELAEALKTARETDIIVTTGGASVGDHDHVAGALAACGAQIDFWKIAMRPGKPLIAGTLGEAAFLGLPGNPVSAFVTALLFLKPLVAKLGGAGDALPPTLRATLIGALPPTAGRTDHIRAHLDNGRAAPVGIDDSAVLLGLSQANALIVRPPHSGAASDGESVDVIPLLT